MSKVRPEQVVDIYYCRQAIQKILDEYNCSLMDGDEGSHVLLLDNDTKETINVIARAS